MTTTSKFILLGALGVLLAIGAYRALTRSTGDTTLATVVTAANSDVEHLTDADDHKALVEDSKIPVLLDFHATWCPPCKALSPHIEAVATQYKGKVKVYKVDVDKNPKLARKYNVTRMPTMFIVLPAGKGGPVKHVGYKDLAELQQWINDSTK